MKHIITYDGRENSLPCKCRECGKFAGYLSNIIPGFEEEECPGPPMQFTVSPVRVDVTDKLLIAAAVGATSTLLLVWLVYALYHGQLG